MISTPVARGSSVPACPTFFILRVRRILATTSWLVIPSALLMFKKPETSDTGLLPLLDGSFEHRHYPRFHFVQCTFDGCTSRRFMATTTKRKSHCCHVISELATET